MDHSDRSIGRHRLRYAPHSFLTPNSELTKVVFFHRKARRFGNFSIENLFEGIRRHLPAEIQPVVAVSRFESKGFFPRLHNAVEAVFRQGDINHVTGDVHFLTLLLRKRRTVLTIHDCAFMEHPSAVARWLLLWFWLRLPVRRAAVVTTVSEATKAQVLRFVRCDPDKITVIPNFISGDFRPHPRPFCQEKPVLLQIGTAPNKNLERLAHALKGIPCRLQIIGRLSESQQKHLQNLSIDFEARHNLSEAEIIACYESCDLLTFVSTHEGFGLPILEAQAVGRPVVTSDVLSMPEVAGGAACLVNPADVDSIRAGILQVIGNEAYRTELIEKGLANVRRFHPEHIARQYAEAYRRLARKPAVERQVRESARSARV